MILPNSNAQVFWTSFTSKKMSHFSRTRRFPVPLKDTGRLRYYPWKFFERVRGGRPADHIIFLAPTPDEGFDRWLRSMDDDGEKTWEYTLGYTEYQYITNNWTIYSV